MLKYATPEAGGILEVLELTIRFRDDCRGVIAGLSLPSEMIPQPAKMVKEIREHWYASVDCLRKFGRKLGFVQTAVTGRCGNAPLKPIHELMAKGGGQLPTEVKNGLRWWAGT